MVGLGVVARTVHMDSRHTDKSDPPVVEIDATRQGLDSD